MESSPAAVAATAPQPDPAVLPAVAPVSDAQPVGHDGNGAAPSADRRPNLPLIAPPIPGLRHRLGLSARSIVWPRLRVPSIAWPWLRVPSIAWPRLRRPSLVWPRIRPPRISRLVLVVAAVLAVLLIAPLAYVLLPGIRPAAARQGGEAQSATGASTPAANPEQAVAIAGVKAKTGLPYGAAGCVTSGPCLTISRETVGQDAAAVLFSTAGSGGRQCVSYVYRSGGSWHLLEVACALPGQLSPLAGHDATVHVPGNCANVRDQASLSGAVVACVKDGATVRIDGGPTYADGRLWWHQAQGWMAHDFLTGP